MNISHTRIDENTFKVLTDKGEEITYKVGNNVSDLDIFGIVFSQNELEYRERKINTLCNDRTALKFSLCKLKEYFTNNKKLNSDIKEEKKEVMKINHILNSLKEGTQLQEISRTPKKLVKKDK